MMHLEMEPDNDVESVDIMNVKTLIDVAFGHIEENRVNFKLIQTVLYLLARQLKILDRRVAFEGPFASMMDNLSNLEVTEVKIHAMQPKAKKGGKAPEKASAAKPTKGKRESITKGGKDGKAGKGRGKPEDYQKALEEFIAMREKEIRVIHQRADSTQDPDINPKPMTSIDTMEAQHEKLLVVERVSSSSRGIERVSSGSRGIERVSSGSRGSRSSRKLSVVTQEEFMKLARTVRSLQAHFGPIGTAGFPANAQLMESLRENASLTDAMAALQLSARLEAAEKVLGCMTQILSTVVKATPGMQIDSETRVFLGAAADIPIATGAQRATVMEPTELVLSRPTEEVESEESSEGEFVRAKDLDVAVKKLYNEIMQNVKNITSINSNHADQAMKLAATLETKLVASMNVGPRMANLEEAVSAYTEQVTALDTGLTSQMANYQEQLTQMQQELEIGLDAMAEAMANTGGDTVAMAELNNNFASLQMDFDNMTFRQKKVSDALDTLKANIASLLKQIEMLRDTKSDRDEVTDALRDKAGIKDLNGLVPLEQFNAVRGDFEKRILEAYSKFNNQEIVWQKAIDELLRELGEKGDLVQLYSLKDDMVKHLEAINMRMQAIANIVGDPKSAITTKMLFRDTACICCSTPATMDLQKQSTVPVLPKIHDGRKRGQIGEHDKEISGDGDTRPCYFGLPVLHSIDPRAHFCQRYCGGSHTLLPTGPPKIPPSFIITPVRKGDVTELGTDGKMYKVDEQYLKPCVPCNKPDIRDPPPPSPIAKDGLEENETTTVPCTSTLPVNSTAELTKERTV